MDKTKWVSVSAVVTKDQQQELDQKAAESGMSRSQYIIARLFIDEDDTVNLIAKKLSNFDKDLILAILRSYMILQKLSANSLAKKDINQAFKLADEVLVEKGYFDNEDERLIKNKS